MSEYVLRECHEAVERDDRLEPCDKPAVGWRVEPEENKPYPVCTVHHRWPYADEWVAALVLLDKARKGYETRLMTEAEAKIVRVEALADEWQRTSLPGMTDWDYAQDVRAALDGS